MSRSKPTRNKGQRWPAGKRAPFGRCLSCETPLGKPGGYESTKLCGPCCTGEAETVSDFTVEW